MPALVLSPPSNVDFSHLRLPVEAKLATTTLGITTTLHSLTFSRLKVLRSSTISHHSYETLRTTDKSTSCFILCSPRQAQR